MKELVGICMKCRKTVYCIGGFLNGVKQDGGLLCLDCYAEKEKQTKT